MKNIENNNFSENNNPEKKKKIDAQLKEFLQSEIVDLQKSIDKESTVNKESSEHDENLQALIDYMLEVVKGKNDARLDKLDNQENIQNILDELRQENAEEINNVEESSQKESSETIKIDKKLDDLSKKSPQVVVNEARLYYRKLLLEAADVSRNEKEAYVAGPLGDQAEKLFGPLSGVVKYLREKAA